MKRLLLFLIACGMCIACNTQQNKNVSVVDSSQIVLISDTLQTASVSDTVRLGQMRQGEVVRRDMVLKNGLDNPVVVLSVATSCGCTSVEFPKQPLKPGETAPFSFEFDSKGFVGVLYKKITVKTSGASNPYVLVVVADVLR